MNERQSKGLKLRLSCRLKLVILKYNKARYKEKDGEKRERGENVNCRIFEPACQWTKTNCRPILL